MDEHLFSFLFSLKLFQITFSWININTAQSIAKVWMLMYPKFLILKLNDWCSSIAKWGHWEGNGWRRDLSLHTLSLTEFFPVYNAVPLYNKLPPQAMWKHGFLSLRPRKPGTKCLAPGHENFLLILCTRSKFLLCLCFLACFDYSVHGTFTIAQWDWEMTFSCDQF